MRFLSSVTAALGSVGFAVQKAGAALTVPVIPNLPGEVNLITAIINVVVAVLNFVLLLAVVFVIIAGIRLIVSGGDEGEKDKAKKTIIYVIAGIIIILLARAIVSFVAGLIK